MKNIRFNTFLLAGGLMLSLASCKKDFIEIKPEGQFLTENYYRNRDEAYAGLVAAYDPMRKNAGGFDNMITFMNAGSDDNYAGGGGATDGAGIQGFSNFTINPTIVPNSFGAIITRVFSEQIFCFKSFLVYKWMLVKKPVLRPKQKHYVLLIISI